uniref:Uncharacterized protein n=1 Tax=Globodera rostochiensis TaxID=31243 RepID=A0A914HKL1_GLORO
MSSLSFQTIPKEQCQKDLFKKVQEFENSALGGEADPARGIKANNMVTTSFNDRISDQSDQHALPFVLSRRGKRADNQQPAGCIALGLSAFVAAVIGGLEVAKVLPGGVIAIAICFGIAVLSLILMICACNWLK